MYGVLGDYSGEEGREVSFRVNMFFFSSCMEWYFLCLTWVLNGGRWGSHVMFALRRVSAYRVR